MRESLLKTITCTPDELLPGDIVHDHDDKLVLNVEVDEDSTVATIRWMGTEVRSHAGIRAQLTVSRR
jgi:hypothetical protein